MITGVRKIVIPVDDEDRAREFWTTAVGFRVTRDEQYGKGQRWLEVAPPDDSVILILSRRHPGDAKPQAPEGLPHSPVMFNSDDIQETYRVMCERGVRFPAPPTEMPFGWWAMFEDQDGCRYALGEW